MAFLCATDNGTLSGYFPIQPVGVEVPQGAVYREGTWIDLRFVERASQPATHI